MKIPLPKELTEIYYVDELDFLNYLDPEEVNSAIFIILHPYAFNMNASELSDYAKDEVYELLKAHMNDETNNSASLYKYFNEEEYVQDYSDDNNKKYNEDADSNLTIMTTTHYILDT